ncbi:MAG: exopolysaccharide biosynthesis polyprenyl glycosylphosphotransferase [Solirubrobacteraceae bacterium]
MASTRLKAPSAHDPVDTISGEAAILDVARPADRSHGRAESDAIGERGLGSWALARLAADSAALAAGWLVAVAVANDAPGAAGPGLLCAVPALVLGTLLVREAASRRLRAQAGEELRIAVTAAAVSTLTVSLLVLLSDAGAVMLQDVVEGGLLAAGAVATTQVGLVWVQAALRRRRGARGGTLVVGFSRVGRLVATRLQAEPGLGLRPIGFLDKEPLAGAESCVVLPVFGASWDLEETVSDQRVDVVVVAFSTAPHHVGLSIVHRCWEMGVQVILVPRLFEVQGVRTQSEHIGGLPLVALNPADPRSWQLRVRYALDRVLAAAGLLVLSPLLGALALAVRLQMGRPVLFRQARMGRDGQVFDMLKFRTMAGDPGSGGEADAGWAAEMVDGGANGEGAARAANGANGEHGAAGSGACVKSLDIARPSTGGDRRTPLGRILRRLSLDELPQLWNVVRGEMALIGPRPERVSYADEFALAVYRYRDRARIKPGITGWAQVNGLRGKTSLADRVEWDNFYIENWSPWLDAKILAKTLARATTSDE